MPAEFAPIKDNHQFWKVQIQSPPQGLVEARILAKLGQKFPEVAEVISPEQLEKNIDPAVIMPWVSLVLECAEPHDQIALEYVQKLGVETEAWRAQEYYSLIPEVLHNIAGNSLEMVIRDTFSRTEGVSGECATDPIQILKEMPQTMAEGGCFKKYRSRLFGVSYHTGDAETDIRLRHAVAKKLGKSAREVRKELIKPVIETMRWKKAQIMKKESKKGTTEPNLETRVRIALVGQYVSDEGNFGKFGWREMQYLDKSLVCYESFFDYIQQLNVRHERGVEVFDINEAKQKDLMRHKWLEKYLWLKTEGNMSTSQVLKVMGNEMQRLGFQEFLNDIPREDMRQIVPGFVAELIVALEYLDQGYEVQVADFDNDHLGIDLIARKGNVREFLQVKGQSALVETKSRLIVKGQAIPGYSKHELHSFDTLASLALDNGASAKLIEAPTSADKYLSALSRKKVA